MDGNDLYPSVEYSKDWVSDQLPVACVATIAAYAVVFFLLFRFAHDSRIF